MIGASKKGLPVLIASLAAMTAVFAGSGEMKPNGCKGPTLCHTRPDIDSNDFMIDVGFLVEQMILSGTTYGYVYGAGDTAGDQSVVAYGRRPSFNLDWGVTVTVGRHFEHDDWDLTVQFDWLQGTGKDFTGTDFNERFIPVNLRTVAADAGANLVDADTASDRLKITYYMLDVMLGRGNYFAGCFHVTPHFGVKAAWMSYNDTVRLTGQTLGTDTYNQTRGSEFWGVGPDFGINGVWGMSEGIGWFCDNSIAILLGYAKISDHSWAGSDATNYTNRYKESGIPVLSPSLSTFIGLQYEQTVYYGCQHIRIRGGWDSVFYFNQNYRTHIYNENPSTSAKFHTQENDTFGATGLRLTLAWDF